MAAVEQKQVPAIIIHSSPRFVSSLEAHSRALRSSLGETIATFSTRLGLDSSTLGNFEYHGYLTRASMQKMATRLTEDTNEIVERNPHALMIVTIVTLLDARKDIEEKKRTERDNADLIALRLIRERALGVLETGLGYEGKIIFRYSERDLKLGDGRETPDTRTTNQKWHATLAATPIGTATRLVRCDQGMNRESWAKSTGIPLPEVIEIEKNRKPPTSEQVSTIAALAPFADDSLLVEQFIQKTTELPTETNGSLATNGFNQELLTTLSVQPTIGATLRALRELNHLSLRELGSLLYTGVNAKQNISQLERGRMKFSEISWVNLLKKLGIDIHNPIMHIFLDKYAAET